MDMIDATKVFLQKGFTFTGRARRAEYWYSQLTVILVMILLKIIGSSAPFTTYYGDGTKQTSSELFGNVFLLLVIIPCIAVACRRLHDINKSGWWQLLNLIPLIGPLIMLFLCLQKGTLGANRFGDDPLASTNNVSS